MTSSKKRVTPPGKHLGEGITEAVRIIISTPYGKDGGKKPRKRKPVILTTSIRLVHGNLRKNACRNRATLTGAMCGSVWRTETRTLAGKLVSVRCLICRELKRITKLGEKLEQDKQERKRKQ